MTQSTLKTRIIKHVMQDLFTPSLHIEELNNIMIDNDVEVFIMTVNRTHPTYPHEEDKPLLGAVINLVNSFTYVITTLINDDFKFNITKRKLDIFIPHDTIIVEEHKELIYEVNEFYNQILTLLGVYDELEQLPSSALTIALLYQVDLLCEFILSNYDNLTWFPHNLKEMNEYVNLRYNNSD